MGSETSDATVFEERRAQRRVRDAIGLLISVVSVVETGASGAAEGGNKPSKAAPHRTRVRKQNKYEIAGYAQVKANYPEVANYIAELEERIRTLLLQGDHSPERPSHKVSLSASGLAFADDRIMQTGDTLELNLTLFPQLQKINCRGRIVSVGDASEVSEGAKRTYRVEFTDLSADDASCIDKHVKSLEGNVSRYTEV